MTVPHQADTGTPPSGRTILVVTLLALATAFIILFGAVLPAEYGRDPLGLGKLTGIAALWGPEEKQVTAAVAQAPAAHSYAMPFRSDVIDIPLKAGGDPERGDQVEYKVHMARGSALLYAWAVPGIAVSDEFYTEFHGHTVEQNKAMTVAYYRKATGTSDNGILTAPFGGVHGWYFQNQSAGPVVVRLRLSGFYRLVPDGQPGNEASLHARAVPF